MDINANNVQSADIAQLRSALFGMIHDHINVKDLDGDAVIVLMNYYAATFTYFAELYSTMIQEVRTQVEVGDRWTQGRARDRRDTIEQAMKALKLQYDSLSRVVTVLIDHTKRNTEV